MTKGVDDLFAWTRRGAPQQILSVLNARAGETRFVGGCVRDSLLGKPPGEPGATDIDLATVARPELVLAALKDARIRAIPTGIEHGTVTAVIDGTPFEITTLRADIATDGRRATVAFTTDWEVDASRRDFTINALYLSSDGSVFDSVGGQADLKARRVRFIGDPAARIEEDYLRILRFLRFTARFSTSLEPMGLAACEGAASGLGRLSKERIWHEVARFIPAANAAVVMAAAGARILPHILPEPPDPPSFAAVCAAAPHPPSVPLGVAALWPTATGEMLRRAFKPPTAVIDAVKALQGAAMALAGGMGQREALYRFGRQASCDGARLSVARGNEITTADLHAIEALPIPVLPFRGADFVSAGLPEGQMVGKAMSQAEAAWIAAGFPEDTGQVQSFISQAVAAVSGA